MVSSKNRDWSKFRNYNNKTDALTDWIKKVKSKKVVKKRMSRGTDLRSLAILTRTLISAEETLRRKHQERADKWAQIRHRLNESNNDHFSSTKLDEDDEKQKNEIESIWKNCDQLNGLDSFINNLSSIKSSVVR